MSVGRIADAKRQFGPFFLDIRTAHPPLLDRIRPIAATNPMVEH